MLKGMNPFSSQYNKNNAVRIWLEVFFIGICFTKSALSKFILIMYFCILLHDDIIRTLALRFLLVLFFSVVTLYI